jgi:hypothetical protein
MLKNLLQNSKSLHDESPEAARRRKIIFQYNDAIYDKSIDNIMLNWEKNESISSKIKYEISISILINAMQCTT